MPPLTTWLASMDSFVAACFGPLAAIILVSGLDDIVLLGMWSISLWRGQRTARTEPEPELAEKRIAIFVPLWHEHSVIGGMLDHNVHAIRYSNFDFFIGVYPNDDLTMSAMRLAEARHAKVHIAVCPHDGPTSKADCLNWIYQHMLLHEEERGAHFDVVMTHDAEDLIHPEALRIVNRECERYAMVQVPVLPLATPPRDFVHGVYIDEFSEYQIKDMRAREMLGGFIPSNGVGTGFRRDALDRLAATSQNRIFEPSCLTEDYENGLRIHLLGCRQHFVPLRRENGMMVATREYFPRTMRGAIRQRTRWITGISLQSWERNGWHGGLRNAYWFWRDRKGLVGNPASLATNLVLAYGILTWIFAQARGVAWGLAVRAPHYQIFGLTLVLPVMQTGFRMACVERLYGWRMALGVPLRVPVSNVINSFAGLSAVARYAVARAMGRPLRWIKTEHAYPSLAALREHKRKLGEILVTSGWITEDQLQQALATQPEGIRIGEHLMLLGCIGETDLYDALSLQQGLPSGYVEPDQVRRNAVRALPRHLTSRRKVLPYRIDGGAIFLASTEIPTEDMTGELRNFTRLELRFHLVTPSNYQQLETVVKG